SRDVALTLGSRAHRVVSLPDSVFRFNRPVLPAPAQSPPRLVLSVRSWEHAAGGEIAQERYRREIARFCTRAVRERQAQITFLSTCQGVKQYPIDDAAEAIRIIALVDEADRAN